MSSFTIHIVSSDFAGEIGTFDLEKNFFRKYDNVKKGISPAHLLRIGSFVQEDIKAFARKNKWTNVEKAILLTVISPAEVAISVEESQKKKVNWLNKGTKGHFIKPKNKLALYWQVPGVNQWGAKFVGGEAFSKGHWVSGIIGMDFFKLTRDARSKVQNYLNKIKIFSNNKNTE